MRRTQIRIAKADIFVETLTDSEKVDLQHCLKVGTIPAGTVFRFTPGTDAYGVGVWQGMVSVPPRSNRMGSPYTFIGKEIEAAVAEKSVLWAEEKSCSLAFPEGMKIKLRKDSKKVTIEFDSPEAAAAMFEQLVREAKK